MSQHIASDQIDARDHWIIESATTEPALLLGFTKTESVEVITPSGGRWVGEPYWYAAVPHDRVLALTDWLGERIEALATAAQAQAVELLKYQGDAQQAERASLNLGLLGQRIAILRHHRNAITRDLPF